MAAALPFVAVGSAIFKGFASAQAGEARAEAAGIRRRQEEISARQRSIQRTGQVNRVLAEQTALESARGIALSSPSFFAIQQETMNQFAQDENADALNLGFKEQALDIQASNARIEGLAGFAGSLFDAQKIFNESKVATPTLKTGV